MPPPHQQAGRSHSRPFSRLGHNCRSRDTTPTPLDRHRTQPPLRPPRREAASLSAVDTGFATAEINVIVAPAFTLTGDDEGGLRGHSAIQIDLRGLVLRQLYLDIHPSRVLPRALG